MLSEIPCPNVTHPTNGSVSSFTGVFGDIITWTCEPGFEFPDQTSIKWHICNSTGLWNETVPVCQGINDGVWSGVIVVLGVAQNEVVFIFRKVDLLGCIHIPF